MKRRAYRQGGGAPVGRRGDKDPIPRDALPGPLRQALTEVQRLVGDCFADIQGGRFANNSSDRIISFFLDQRACGAGQSSWGPAVYALVDGQAAADRLEVETRKFLQDLGGGMTFTACADNLGAQITLSKT